MSIPSIYMYLRQTWSPIVLLMNSFPDMYDLSNFVFFLEQADGFLTVQV